MALIPFNHGSGKAKNASGVNSTVDASGKTLLMQAIENKNLVDIDRLLAAGADPLVSDKNNQTAMHKALLTGEIEIVDKVLAAGGSFYPASKKLTPPMEFLIAHNPSLTFLDVLKTRGGKFGLTNDGSTDALHRAVEERNVPLVHYLIAQGLPINGMADFDLTPLHYATLDENAEMVKVLLAAGADPLAGDERLCTPIHICAEQNDMASLKLLMADPEAVRQMNVMQDDAGFTPVLIAARNGYAEIVRFLAALGADINACTLEHYNGLYLALKADSIETVQAMIDLGADPSKTAIQSKNSTPPLHLIKEENFEKLFLMLVQAGADIHARDDLGQTVLHLATEEDNVAHIRLLLNLGADVDAVNAFGRRAIDNALETKRDENAFEIMKLLLAHGADTGISPHAHSMSDTPLQIAARNGEANIADLLLKHGAMVDELGRHLGRNMTAFQVACEYGRLDVAKLLFHAGANHRRTDLRLRTPLHLAASDGRDETVSWLLQITPNDGLEKRDEQGRTPLHVAVATGREEIARLLLQAGATPFVFDEKGFSPLHTATEIDNAPLVKLLAQALKAQGKTVDLPSAQTGETPLHIAVEQGLRDTVSVLVDLGADVTRANDAGLNPLSLSIIHERINIVNFLIETMSQNGLDINTPCDIHGMTALHYAALLSDEKICARLMALGADVNAKTDMNETPLHFAVRAGRVDVVAELFLRHDLIISPNHAGETAEDIAYETENNELTQLFDGYHALRAKIDIARAVPAANKNEPSPPSKKKASGTKP